MQLAGYYTVMLIKGSQKHDALQTSTFAHLLIVPLLISQLVYKCSMFIRMSKTDQQSNE